MTVKTGVVLGRVTSKAKGTRAAGKGWEYTTNIGSTFCLPKDDLLVGRWYFFEVSTDALKTYHYKSHSLLETNNGKGLDDDIQLLKKLTHDVVRMWKSLEDADRQIMMRELGIGLGAAGAASAAATGLYGIAEAIAAESLLGCATGGLSLVIGGALAGFTYLQYEERKSALAKRQQQLARFLQRRTLFARQMVRLMPSQYMHLEVMNPEVQSMAIKLRDMVANMDIHQFFSTDQSTWNWAGATA